MPICSGRHEDYWTTLSSAYDVEIGETVRIREIDDIQHLLINGHDYEYHDGDGHLVYIQFDQNMRKMCGNEYKVLSIRHRLVQLDTDIKNYMNLGYWFPFVFLEKPLQMKDPTCDAYK